MEQLEKLRLLLNYFRDKLAEHHLTITDQLSSELISPLYRPITLPNDESILSSYPDDDKQSRTAIAMKLPRTFTSLEFTSTDMTNQEILHSPCYPGNSIEYKKELPADIRDKYAGVSSKKQQSIISPKKNRRKGKVIEQILGSLNELDLFRIQILNILLK